MAKQEPEVNSTDGQNEQKSNPAQPAPAPPVPPAGIKLFTLDPNERDYHERKEARRKADLAAAPAKAQEEEKKRRALYEHLAQVYPLTQTPHGQVWRHSKLGEVAYIEVAINGKFFDPRGMPDDYRPDLDYPAFDQQVDAMAVG